MDFGKWGQNMFKWRKQMKKKKICKNFFRCGKFTFYMSKSFQIWDHLFSLSTFPQGFQNLKKLSHWSWGSGDKIPLQGVRNANTKKILLIKAKFAKNIFFCAAILQIWDHFFPLLFPKDFISLKNLGIRLQEIGAKRR